MEAFSGTAARLLAAITDACAAYIRGEYSRELPAGDAALPGYFSDACVSLKKPALSGLEAHCDEAPGEPFGRVFIRGGCICFDLSAYCLEGLVDAALALPPFTVPELVAAPAGGCAPDEEACAYACAGLYAAVRCGKADTLSPASRAALITCLRAAESGEGADLASAVRRVLAALKSGCIGGNTARACLRMLAYAERRNKNKC